jgi:hypothetical protein
MPKTQDDAIELLITCPSCGHTHEVEVDAGELPLVRNASREKLFKLAEVEEILGLSRRRLKQLIYDGKLRAERGKGATSPWFVSESAIGEYRRSRKQ